MADQREVKPLPPVMHDHECLAHRHDYYSTNDIAICAYCKQIRYGHAPGDEKCCKWVYCTCVVKEDIPCNPVECAACGISQKLLLTKQERLKLFRRVPQSIENAVDWSHFKK